MYNQKEIERFVKLVEANKGIGDKEKLADIIQKEFHLEKKRSVYTNEFFSVRFSEFKEENGKNGRISNTVLGLSTLLKYDDKPFFVCAISLHTNYLWITNTTFLYKITHSSQKLTINKIRGSFLGSDIIMQYEGIENRPENFEKLFAIHEIMPVEDNIERLVENTSQIEGGGSQLDITPEIREKILKSITTTKEFLKSKEYEDLMQDLSGRVKKVQEVIFDAAQKKNVNKRGRVIEFLITGEDLKRKEQIKKALEDDKPLPDITTEDNLGDYSKVYPNYYVETDIKTKLLFRKGNPKAYNVDKLLEFLATEKAVYMIFILGIKEDGTMTMKLCSILDKCCIENTDIITQWCGRKSRGVAQFREKGLIQMLEGNKRTQIDEKIAREFLEKLMEIPPKK